MTDRPTLLIVHQHLGQLATPLASRYEILSLWEGPSDERLAEVRAIVVAGEFEVDRALIDRMPKLGLIACFAVGYDGVDVAWAASRGLQVSHAQDANDEDVADHAIGLILGHRREIVSGDATLRDGGWHAREKRLTTSLGGAKLGIVGLGGIGRAVARRAEVMRMPISWWGPNEKPGAEWPRADTLLQLAKDSDILVVAARAHGDNVGMISAAVIEALGPRGLLVNVARGQLVDEAAMIEALKAGTLGGAALDVFETEPTPAERWADVPNTVLTPHTAGATREAVQLMLDMLFANLAAFFAGEALPNAAV